MSFDCLIGGKDHIYIIGSLLCSDTILLKRRCCLCWEIFMFVSNVLSCLWVISFRRVCRFYLLFHKNRTNLLQVDGINSFVKITFNMYIVSFVSS